MAVIAIEGFDHESTTTFTQKQGWAGTAPAAMVTGRLGGYAFERQNTGSIAATSKTLPSTYATLIAGFAFRSSSVTPGGARVIFEFRAGATETVKLRINTTGTLSILNSSDTVIATGATTLVANTWYYAEMKVFINGASGTCELKLNGVSEIASTVGNFGSANLDRVTIYQPANAGLTIAFDDLYVVDTTGSAPNNTFLGDCRVETLLPTGDGANTAWTASAGSDYTTVDENAPGHNSDTDYISSATPGDRNTFTFPALAVSSGTVFGVAVNNAARKDDAGARTIASVIRQSSTNYDGTTSGGLTTGYLGYQEVYDKDPTGSAWTISTVNANEYGVKMVA